MADTIATDRWRGPFAASEALWLFGYGSLIYRAGFDYEERRPATVEGWARRFWQGSHDHRGTPETPGRVVTLVADPDARCLGMAYRIRGAHLDYLDHREKNGYRRFVQPMTFADGSVAQGLVYIATEANPAWLGPAPIDHIARQIAASSGPSGPNCEYALKLADALVALGADDPHVLGVAARLRALLSDE